MHGVAVTSGAFSVARIAGGCGGARSAIVFQRGLRAPALLVALTPDAVHRSCARTHEPVSEVVEACGSGVRWVYRDVLVTTGIYEVSLAPGFMPSYCIVLSSYCI